VPVVPQPVGQRPASPQQPAAPAASADGGEAASSPSRAPLPPVGGGITVPPLPPIPGSAQGRRPLSNEDFEEELDIPEFLKQ
jgi:cell division protein FtsZ